MDGYIGWSLAMHLAKRHHIVSGVDNFARRANVESLNSHSAIPILDMELLPRMLQKLLRGFQIFKQDQFLKLIPRKWY
jgi:nucleoside-diphosphate-sugar epimerase